MRGPRRRSKITNNWDCQESICNINNLAERWVFTKYLQFPFISFPLGEHWNRGRIGTYGEWPPLFRRSSFGPFWNTLWFARKLSGSQRNHGRANLPRWSGSIRRIYRRQRFRIIFFGYEILWYNICSLKTQIKVGSQIRKRDVNFVLRQLVNKSGRKYHTFSLL